ncbi:uncharacterized protein LOC110467418 [Mizuhopecten yessoensis]|uniref:Uncharacterized protein n=1 Tax=Mizuhopecten yessoensis TaxID=6573 RepID=A0A210R1M9_MIZYE|nr:uncharacterized protein LOC110467418 [Mizuhopecten yessoensis]OWF54844.1 hypothetical protein KP79_PYT20830 [Mizuhopecten yessoensis]
MAKPSTYVNVAPPPPPPDRNRKRSICQSCNCPNCHDMESCTGTVINGGYLRTVADRPPVPCRQRQFTDDFSPEEYFKECDKPKPDTRRMKELDIPLPLPSAQSNDSVFDSLPSSNPPVPFLHEFHTHIPPKLSIHDRFIQRHPSPQPPAPSQIRPHRKPSDELPNPNVLNQLLMNEQTVEVPRQKEKGHDQLPQFELTLPRKKSERRKTGRRQPAKVPLWMKLGTIFAFIPFFGLSYMVFKTGKDIFFVHNRHLRPAQHSWNYSEPDESKLDTTVCFSCDLVDEFRSRHRGQQLGDLKIYGFKSSDKRRHCCMDQLGHTKWMVNMMKTREILGRQEARNPDSDGVCSAKSTHVPVYNRCSQGEASLKLDKENTTPMCKGAGIKVTNDSLLAEEEGLYIVYMTLTVTLSPKTDCGKKIESKVLRAHLHCNKSAKKRCIEMETYNVTRTNTDSTYFQHSFNLYTMKNFTRGEQFFPSLSHPSYLYTAKYGNYIGVVQL